MIIICESQCVGAEHAKVNAALISCLFKTYKEEVVFVADETHKNCVLQFIEADFAGINVTSYVVKVPNKYDSSCKRIWKELRILKQASYLSEKSKCNKILFSSITSPGLYLLWLLIPSHMAPIIIIHGILESLVKRPSLKPWEFIFWFRFPFLIASSKRFRYVLLGEPIKSNLFSTFPKMRNNIVSINMPYIFQKTIDSSFPTNNEIKFGYFGVGSKGKGFPVFCKLSEELSVNSFKYKPTFILIGKVLEKDITVNENYVKVPFKKELNQNEFDILANSLHYSLYLYNSNVYKYVASAAFFDSLAYAKPIIAINNSFFQYYFNLLGNIGYLCEGYSELKTTVEAILNGQKISEYDKMVKTIITRRESVSIFAKDSNVNKFW